MNKPMQLAWNTLESFLTTHNVREMEINHYRQVFAGEIPMVTHIADLENIEPFFHDYVMMKYPQFGIRLHDNLGTLIIPHATHLDHIIMLLKMDTTQKTKDQWLWYSGKGIIKEVRPVEFFQEYFNVLDKLHPDFIIDGKLVNKIPISFYKVANIITRYNHNVQSIDRKKVLRLIDWTWTSSFDEASQQFCLHIWIPVYDSQNKQKVGYFTSMMTYPAITEPIIDTIIQMISQQQWWRISGLASENLYAIEAHQRVQFLVFITDIRHYFELGDYGDMEFCREIKCPIKVNDSLEPPVNA